MQRNRASFPSLTRERPIQGVPKMVTMTINGGAPQKQINPVNMTKGMDTGDTAERHVPDKKDHHTPRLLKQAAVKNTTPIRPWIWQYRIALLTATVGVCTIVDVTFREPSNSAKRVHSLELPIQSNPPAPTENQAEGQSAGPEGHVAAAVGATADVSPTNQEPGPIEYAEVGADASSTNQEPGPVEYAEVGADASSTNQEPGPVTRQQT